MMCILDLTDILYHFTPCGNVGRVGPTYQACMEHYNATNSRLSHPGLLLQKINTTDGVMFEGAQIFLVPRFGLYNITVAGAMGGRGICNTEQGYGIARTVQVELYSSLQLLVLVGQHGLDFCDVEPSSTPCVYQPQDQPDAMACNDTWHAYLEDEFLGEHSIETLGGGGGGGASMIRAYTQQGLNAEPMVVGGGGGGSSALLEYDVVNTIGVNTALAFSDVAYRTLINAKSSSGSNDLLHFGRRNSSDLYTAGLGGGYNTKNENEKLNVDGKYLSSSRDFALGGRNCDGNDPSNGAFGGFGGGGGACAGGGGGGGYLGGSVLGTGKTTPGGGGLSITGSFGTSFKLIRFVEDKLNPESDGYVDIIDADCECIFKCEVYYEDDQFECTCPGKTLLAPDSSDCYTGESLMSVHVFCFSILAYT